MSSGFKCRIEIDADIPNFSNASVPLKQIANKIAVNSRKNIRNQTNLDGSSFAKLSVKTIKDKKREGSSYPYRALYRKGIMYNAIHVYNRGKNVFEVGIIPRGKPRRDYVGYIHQEIGPIIRSFLGMNSQIAKWAKDRFSRWIKECKEKSVKRKINYNY